MIPNQQVLQSYLDDIGDVAPIPTDNINQVDPDISINQVFIPTPNIPLISTGNNANTFTIAMTQSLAQSINLQRIPTCYARYFGSH